MYALIYIFVLLAAVSTTVANPISKVYDELSSLDEEDIAFGIDTSKSQEYNDLTYRVHDFFRQDALNLENSFTVAAEDSDCSANKDRSRSIEIRSQPKSDQTCSPRKSPIWVMPENPACKQDPKGRPRDVYCCLGGYRQGIQKIKLQCVSCRYFPIISYYSCKLGRDKNSVVNSPDRI